MALRIRFLLVLAALPIVCATDAKSDTAPWNENSDLAYFQTLSHDRSDCRVFAAYLKSSGVAAQTFRKALESVVNNAYECILLQQISPEAPFKGYLLYRLEPAGNWQLIETSGNMKPVDVDSKFDEAVASLIIDAGEMKNKVEFNGEHTLDAPAAFLTIKAKNQITRFAAYPSSTSASIFDSPVLKLLGRTFTLFTNIDSKNKQ
jgi:hypothetical protein